MMVCTNSSLHNHHYIFSTGRRYFYFPMHPHSLIPLISSFGLSLLLSEGGGEQQLHMHPGVAVPMRAQAPGHGAMAPRQSAQVRVPVWPRKSAFGRRAAESIKKAEESEQEDEDDGEEMVPPHVVTARRGARSSSVLEGVGRNFKGHNLRRVRNAVLRQTGFLNLMPLQPARRCRRRWTRSTSPPPPPPSSQSATD
ncbi:hypothetical protein ACUV84_029123 [Puccinellia chinampoensis]